MVQTGAAEEGVLKPVVGQLRFAGGEIINRRDVSGNIIVDSHSGTNRETQGSTGTFSSLSTKPIWVVWRIESRKDKPTKVPFNPSTRKEAKADDCSTWTTRDIAELAKPSIIAKSKIKSQGGLGIELADIGDGQHLGGLDLDSCRDPVSGELEPWAQDIMDRFPTYWEVSPSGTGVKGFFLYRSEDLTTLQRAMGTLTGKQYRKAGGGEHGPAIELYVTSRYFAVTEQRHENSAETINSISTESLLWLINEAGPVFAAKPVKDKKQHKTKGERVTITDEHGEVLARDGNILARVEAAANSNTAKGNTLYNILNRIDSYPSRSEAAMALGGALKAAGFNYKAMLEALRAHPATSAYIAEKGERQAQLIWENTLQSPDEPEAAEEAEDTSTPSTGRKRKRTPEADALMRCYNNRFFVCTNAAKTKVYELHFDDEFGRTMFVGQAIANFKDRYRHIPIKVGTKTEKGVTFPVYRPASIYWLGDEERRQYERFVFDPTGKKAKPDEYNLWTGFAFTPAPGSWEKLKTHVREIVCAGDAESYEYLMNWMARLIQHPEERAEVAVVMRGGQGCGKGILAKTLWTIFGQHALQISNPKHLTGTFNAHLRDCVFLFADEAIYADDAHAVGTLNTLITENVIPLEGKGENLIKVKNFLHLMMASNNDWIVPTSLDARRFACLDVLDTKTGDFEYFQAIVDELKAGGYAAMLYELQHRDISGFNIRKIPKTTGLNNQKIESLKTHESWFVDALSRGYVLESQCGLSYEFRKWIKTVTTDLLYESYIQFAKAKHEKRPLSRAWFGRWFTGTLKIKGARPIGCHAVGEERGEKGVGRIIYKKHPTCYVLGTLKQARDAFLEKTGLQIAWPDDDAEEADALEEKYGQEGEAEDLSEPPF